ncbi:helix-turn-helix domain-containing protein [Salsuginibacillus kocurii]|uniref:helix-turn-helix domain-containing protein n=1 Tax=Salsuginibacillus kocurii TaxID=427078 RepID=UPI0003814435|nr:helix-turn-helix transcriptional regulator [Salsuginibacillus kocurii]
MFFEQMSIHQHSYWNPVHSFVLSEDTYPHWNVFCIEDGMMEYQVGEETGQAEFPDLVFCPPDFPLQRKAVTPVTFHFFQFSVPVKDKTLPIGKIHYPDKERLASAYEHFRGMAYEEQADSNKWKAYFLQDLLNVYRFRKRRPHRSYLTDHVKDPVIREIVYDMYDYVFDKYSVSDFAKSAGLSPVQFTRRFKQAVGINPGEYITLLRLRKARDLLLQTDLTIEDIAVQCGYSNGFYFSRIFSKKMHMTPSFFREIHWI